MVDKTKNIATLTALGAVALTASGHEAVAQESGAENAWKFSVEGGLLQSNFSSPSVDPDVANKLGNLDDKEHGGFFAISIGKDLSPGLSWRLSAAFNAFKTAKDSGSNPFASASNKDDLDYQTVDFDIGKDYANNGMEARLFAGFRGVHFKDSAAYDSANGSGKLSTFETADQKSEFTGIGPRAGTEFFVGEFVGLAGGASGAFLVGYRDSSESQSVTTSGGIGAPTTTGSAGKDNGIDWAANLTGYLGVGVRPTAISIITVGYKIDAWWNVRGKTNSTLDRDKEVVSHGPFLKVQVAY